MTEFNTSLSGYHELKPRIVIASRISLKSSTNTIQPYLLQEGMGYDENFVRGYEAYVMDAQHFAINRSEIKFNLISYTTSLSRFINMAEFETIPNTIYLNIFHDIGYAKNDNTNLENKLSNTLLESYGVGLDLVSFYDMVLRFEYAFTTQKTHGFFFHLEKGI